MEVIPPVIPTDFDFNSSAYATASRLMAENTSAPSSPARITELYREFDELLVLHKNTRRRNSLASVPFAWEEKPGVPKSISNLYDEDNFAFDVSGELFPDSSVSAEDLFHDGLIKKVEFEPSQATIQGKNKESEIRGRERNFSGLSSSRSRRTRSLPPVRDSSEPTVPPPLVQTKNTTTMTTSSTTLSSSGSGKGSKKWSFKDLFLFRSASDGRALDRDPLKKYSAIFRKHDEDSRNSSLRDRSGSVSGSKRRGPRVSAHELHYTVNRAVSNDMKKKTFLPYKQGILGRLAFNPAVHALSNGFGFSHKS
ncbi:uncharacterized protein LOC143532003 [Bidens hawaiensis]|uniref:uncharacterized protein LOC143532003 n=1 Tax=Bidens hawaiensis TaxID=980011 RepID=UPI00404906F8